MDKIKQPCADEIARIISTSLAEDIGTGDVTSMYVLSNDSRGSFVLCARETMTICGLEIVQQLFNAVDSTLEYSIHVEEGADVEVNTILCTISGNAQSILTGERVALNLLQRMCGIATLTKAYVTAVANTGAIILDTRKTTPGLREIEKYAVRAGGATNHRMRLDDAILIKDNHITLTGSISEAVAKAKENMSEDLTIIVECDTIEQATEAFTTQADRLLLDNMSVNELQTVVRLNENKLPLEASGGITLENVYDVAQTGVDYISIGALTHSVRSMDIGLDEIMESKNHEKMA